MAEDNCADGETCSRYVLSMSAGTLSYDFTVAGRAYAAVQEGGCYQVVYYPNQGLFAASNAVPGNVATSYVTRIAQSDASACQP